MERLSQYFTLYEFTRSETAARRGIDNTPTPSAVRNMRLLAQTVLDPARYKFGAAVIVTSGFRCQRLNQAVGGVATSQHLTGQAADLVTTSTVENVRLAKIIAQQGLFDQLILEQCNQAVTECQWVHVSYSDKPRHKVMKKPRGVNRYIEITL